VTNGRLSISAAEAATRLGQFTILDVRDASRFDAGHLEASGHIPLAEIAGRRTELPPREARVLVVADDAATAERAAAEIGNRDFASLHWLDAPLATLPGGLASRAPAARLWKPAPFLERVLPSIPRGRAADLAAGAGREAVFLALSGFDVEAWDRDVPGLEMASMLAARNGVALRTVVADLEQPTSPLPEDTFDLVVCFRFLHRPLLPAMARALAPGGTLVYETFRTGQERYGKPCRPRFLLEPHELARAFAQLEILTYEESEPPGGPVTARLLARRPVAR
jgi:SAM-dependent methyltransferase